MLPAGYAEWIPPADLAVHVDRLWVRGAGEVPRALPQPAVDLLVLPDGTPWLAGPETRTRRGPLPPGGSLVGVRLRPGGAALFGIAADEVPLGGVPLHELPGAGVGAVAGPRLAGALHVLRTLAGRSTRPPDHQVQQVLAGMHAAPGSPVGRHAAAAGLSQRQLRRRFTTAVGLRPKAYVRVVRLHRALAAARDDVAAGRRPDWARIAHASGFYDQPHLLGEFRHAVGVPPNALLGGADVRFLQAGRCAAAASSAYE
ncbi:MAG: helix-turn-helix transcriptional regulator [Umezawaea sp.]